MEKKISKRLLTIGVILVIINAVALVTKSAMDSVQTATIFGLTSTTILFFIAFAHGVLRYGWLKMFIFFGITFIISWSYESLSILTSFPFGWYHYTDWWSPMLGLVPIMIMPAYFGMGYFAWIIAHILLDKKNNLMNGSEIVLIPVLASFVMVMWDICMDPFNSTIQNYWIWHNGGAYFGVPFVNFLGWFLCVFTFFFIFSLILRKQKNIEAADISISNKTFWLLPVILYGSNVIEFLSNMIGKENVEVIAQNGIKYKTGDIYGTLGLMSIFTMLFISFYAVIKVIRKSEMK